MRLTAESLGLENSVAETNRRSRSGGLRPHDLRHHAITKLAESPEASEQTIRALAGHVSREMLEHYSHVRQQATRKAVESLDNVTIREMGGSGEKEGRRKKRTNSG
jgi:integrase